MISYLALGSNIGDRSKWLRFGVSEFFGVQAVSPVYETEPVGGPSQGQYLNIVIRIDTKLSASDLLKKCHQVENDAGRQRVVVNGPRTLDVDILLYGDEKINLPELIIPHPRMDSRNFVIQPLLDIYPDYASSSSSNPEGVVKKLGPL